MAAGGPPSIETAQLIRQIQATGPEMTYIAASTGIDVLNEIVENRAIALPHQCPEQSGQSIGNGIIFGYVHDPGVNLAQQAFEFPVGIRPGPDRHLRQQKRVPVPGLKIPD
jgi:hypothetical protein